MSEKLYPPSLQNQQQEEQEEGEERDCFGRFDNISDALEIPENIKQGNVQILFAHPESLLSVKGRTLLESKLYQ